VVEKRVVPKERVRLGKETVTEQEQVGGEVRQEHIEVEGQGQVRRRGRR
jgi:stress response protein YsnF